MVISAFTEDKSKEALNYADEMMDFIIPSMRKYAEASIEERPELARKLAILLVQNVLRLPLNINDFIEISKKLDR